MPQQPTPSPMAMLFPFLIMLFIFYVMVFRPQAKARRAHQEMLKNLKKYDEVATAGGMLGTVVNVRPDTITLRVNENVRIEMEKSAVTRLVKSRSEPAQEQVPERKAADA